MSLTPRQVAILQLTADGHTYAAIGRQLDIGESAVKHETMHLRAKLGAANTAHAVHLAHRRGILGDHGGAQDAVAQVLGRIADQLGYDIALLPRAERTTP